jgi:hypothetical protein
MPYAWRTPDQDLHRCPLPGTALALKVMGKDGWPTDESIDPSPRKGDVWDCPVDYCGTRWFCLGWTALDVFCAYPEWIRESRWRRRRRLNRERKIATPD